MYFPMKREMARYEHPRDRHPETQKTEIAPQKQKPNDNPTITDVLYAIHRQRPLAQGKNYRLPRQGVL